MSISTSYSLSEDLYKRKYRRLKKFARQLIFVNAALADSTAHAEEKTARIKLERKFLLKKLFQCQSLSDASKFIAAEQASSAARHAHCDYMRRIKLSKLKQIAIDKARALETREDGSGGSSNVVKVYHPIEFDSFGRPLLPMDLGELVLNGLGQVDSSRPSYHCELCFYPPGFESKRVYASLRDPTQPAEYICRVLDSNSEMPQFEVSVTDVPDLVLKGYSPDECHRRIIDAIAKLADVPVLDASCDVDGATFFGLSHPTVLHYHQSFPNAKHCTGYRFRSFKIAPPQLQHAPSSKYVGVSFSVFASAFRDERDKLEASAATRLSDDEDTDE